MDIDYLYCIVENQCIHRRGCQRWIGNYSDEYAIEESNTNVDGYINHEKCINSEPYPFAELDRFRNSTGITQEV